MRDNCEEIRDLAMIDMLASTGMRVGEMVLLNRDDINFAERECVVFGKGDKERIVYFDARANPRLSATAFCSFAHLLSFLQCTLPTFYSHMLPTLLDYFKKISVCPSFASTGCIYSILGDLNSLRTIC